LYCTLDGERRQDDEEDTHDWPDRIPQERNGQCRNDYAQRREQEQKIECGLEYQ
jgi:hypothetical protein